MEAGRTTRLGLVLLAGCLVSGACGCAYSTKRLTDFPGARTIAVLPFENTGFRRDLELRLSMAVADEIRARTPLGLASPASADLLLIGTMAAEERAIGLDENGAVIQKRLQGWLRFELRDRRRGVVVRRATVQATTEFRPGVAGESLEGAGTEDWIRRVAERVVQSLETGF